MKAFTQAANIAVAATKPGKAVVLATLSPELECLAGQFAGALQETVSLSETLGALAFDAGMILKTQPDNLEPFVDACRQMCDAVGLTGGSFKVYLSNIRGVCRAIAGGWSPAAGMTLRAMYDAAPKGLGANKGNAGPRTDVKAKTAPAAEPSDDGDDVAAPLAPSTSKADRRRAAMVELFGHSDDELDAALAWAAKNELSFVRYVKANLSVAAEPKFKKAA